jgi:hypothetical protein
MLDPIFTVQYEEGPLMSLMYAFFGVVSIGTSLISSLFH